MSRPAAYQPAGYNIWVSPCPSCKTEFSGVEVEEVRESAHKCCGGDKVNPPHYTATAVEPIDAIEAWGLGYHLGNVVKYIARHQRKGAPLEDLRKARWYLDRAIKAMEGK